VSRLRVLKLGGYWNGSSPSILTLLHILSECPKLEEFALQNLSDADPDICDEDQGRISTKTVYLPRLVKASFYYTGIMRTRTILNHLSFPALQMLELCYLDDLTPFLERLKQQSLTSFPLRYLRIESSFFNEIKFVSLLDRLPSLVSHELVDCEDASSHFLKVIEIPFFHSKCLVLMARLCTQGLTTPSARSTLVCPKLEILNLDGCTNLGWDSLRTFIEDRLPGHSFAYSRQVSRRLLTNGSVPISSASAYAKLQQLLY